MIEIRTKLDRIERLFAGTGNYPSDIAEYHGDLDESAMADAYIELSRRYPVLTAKILNDEARCEFYPLSRNDDRIRFIDGDELTLQREIRELRGQDSDAARLIIVRTGADRGFVAFSVNHALFDFPSFGFLFNRLWDLYTQAHLGQCGSWDADSSPTPSLPLSPERIVMDRWLDEGCVVPEAGLSTLSSKQFTPVIQRMVELTVAETSNLLAVARRRSTSVHALVCAAILTALRDHKTHAGEELMVCRSAVNLRNRLSCDIKETETTVLQGFHDAEVKVCRDAQLSQVGREIKKQLASDLENKSLKMVWERAPSQPSSLFEKRLAQVMVTNWGVLPKLKHPSNLNIVDRMRGWLKNEQVAWIGKNPIYILATYGNRLKLIGMYSSAGFTEGEADSFNERILTRLREAR